MLDATVQMIDLKDIVPGNNDRTVFAEGPLMELAQSIKANGLMQPITVRPIAQQGMFGATYQIVAGERRYRATGLAGLTAVPAIVRELDDRSASALMLAENTARADLTPMDEANAYGRRIAEKWTIEEIAMVAGRSPGTVERRLKLLKLRPDIAHLVAAGQLGVGFGEALSRVDHNRQGIAMRALNGSDGRMSLAMFRALIDQLEAEQQQEGLFSLDEIWQAKAEDMRAAGGNGVVIDWPEAEGLPDVRADWKCDNAAEVGVRYMQDLQERGLLSEAAAVGKVMRALMAQRLPAPRSARP